MIHINFSLRNPFSNVFKSKILLNTRVFEHKFIEVEYIRDTDIIGLWFDLTMRQSHAGIRFGLSLLSFGIYFTFEDVRHWNRNNNCWEKYDDEIEGC